MEDTIGTTQAANFIPEIWANRALGKLEAELHLAKNVARDFEWAEFSEGDVLHIPKRGTLSANDKSAGTAVTLQNPTATKVDVTLNKHKEVTFLVEDIVRAQENQEEMDGYIEDGMIAIGEQIETDLATLASSLSNTRGTVATDITDAVLRQCRGDLSTNRAPKSNRFLYLEPDQINVILGLTKFTDVSAYGSNMPVQEGEFGSIYGMRVFESLFTQAVSGSPTATHNIAMHKNAMVLATRPMKQPRGAGVTVGVVEKNGIIMRVLYSYNPDYLSDQVTIDVLYGVSTLRPELGVDLLS